MLVMPMQAESAENTIQGGSWIKVFWSWLTKENHVQYLEKTEELQKEIKEIHAVLETYEKLLHKMTTHLEQYEQNEDKYSQEQLELKKQIEIIASSKNEYLDKAEEIETELALYQEENQTLEVKIREMEKREAEYLLKLEQLQQKEYESVELYNILVKDFEEQNQQRNVQIPQAPAIQKSRPTNIPAKSTATA